MNARSYKIVLLLLSLSLISILILQAFWIRNFYLQKKEEFDRAVYTSLEQVSNKLHERENLRTLKNTYIIQNGDTIAHTPSRKMTIANHNKTRVINRAEEEVIIHQQGLPGNVENMVVTQDSIVLMKGPNNLNIVLNDAKKTQIQVRKDQKKMDVLLKEAKKTEQEAKEMQKLVDKMMVEIKINGFDPTNKDSLNAMIKSTLENKGIFIPFEFSMRKIVKNHIDVMAQSDGFAWDKKYYQADLSLNKVFPTHNFLWLQFNGTNNQVLSAMKGGLLLSLIFSLVIMSAFYYCLRLIRDQKKLSEIKNDFINNMTHELKTPIATISLTSDALSNPNIKEDEIKYRDYIHILKEENQKLNDHVERVLQVAMLDKGELKLSRTPVNLVELIEDVIRTHSLLIKKLRAEVVFKKENGPITVMGDTFHLTNMVSNILDNALKYTKGKPLVEISCMSQGAGITIEIKDNGIGIEADKKQKVFDKFYRAQGGNLHDVKGFGLGLSYVKSIVEAHNGTISLETEMGKGSVFTIKFKNNA